MSGTNSRLGRAARLFLLSALAACCSSGAALATCDPTAPSNSGTTSIIPGQAVPCYMTVQPIDVGTTTLSGSVVYAPFNTTSQTGNPTMDFRGEKRSNQTVGKAAGTNTD